MDIFYQHFWDWLILLGLIFGVLYVMKVIGQEKSTFKDESYLVQFSKLSLMIPKWWAITHQTDKEIKFERIDTYYDWFARFIYFPDHEGLELSQLLERKLNQELLEFDSDVTVETDSRVLFRDSEVQEYFQEVIRIEGKASQDEMERVYYDIFLLRGLDDPGYFLFESKSSVLSGSVEGPYFEESLAELSFILNPSSNKHHA